MSLLDGDDGDDSPQSVPNNATSTPSTYHRSPYYPPPLSEPYNMHNTAYPPPSFHHFPYHPYHQSPPNPMNFSDGSSQNPPNPPRPYYPHLIMKSTMFHPLSIHIIHTSFHHRQTQITCRQVAIAHPHPHQLDQWSG